MITRSPVTSRPEDAALLDHADKEGEATKLHPRDAEPRSAYVLREQRCCPCTFVEGVSWSVTYATVTGGQTECPTPQAGICEESYEALPSGAGPWDA